MISQKTIDEVRNSIQIEEIIGEFVELKKKGSSFRGLCPFHNEKTGSFSVAPHKGENGIYTCFGCDATGDAIDFIEEYKNRTFIETIEYLAKRNGIQIEYSKSSKEDKREREEQESIFLLNEFAQKLYTQNLLEKKPRS